MSINSIALLRMSRDMANRILSMWRDGTESYPPGVIRVALYVTGDLDSLR